MKKIFLSYSHKDETFKDQFIIHLSGLKRSNLIEIWDDRQVKIGEKWDEKIKQNLLDSDIVFFLISPDFLASEYINEVEIQQTITRHKNNEACIVPVFLRPCDFASSILAGFQGVPRDQKFISLWSDHDSAYLQIVIELKKILSEFIPLKSSKSNEIIPIAKVKQSESTRCDTPPDIEKWVGREEELQILKSENFKAIFITGFGGQGKSSLATKFVYDQADLYDSWDWRDFREEESLLKTKLFQIIHRYSGTDTSILNLIDASFEEILELFFSTIGEKKILFVFDNIDSYIDYEKFIPLEGFRQLIFNALNRKHKSKFIFTCRPFIKQADVGFHQIGLKGLKFESTIELLDKYKIGIKSEKKLQFYQELHNLTNGHPLWLNLLGAQSVRGIDKLEEFVSHITTHTDFDEVDISKILSDKIIGALWDTLNIKQKKLLRCLSELVRAEEVNNLFKIIENELQWNQFNKSLQTLKLLNLIVTKSGKSEEIELHPLVKSFVKSKFPANERSKFISIIIDYYDKVTYVLKERLSGNESISFYENWTNKVELAVNKNDFKKALFTLEEIAESIKTAGYFEEYIRISKLIFNNIDFDRHLNNETVYFVSQLSNLITVTSESSDFETARKFLNKFRDALKDKGKNYISYCKLECTYSWNKLEFTEAIKWGEKAQLLITNSKVGEDTELEHSLNLAKRDSRTEKAVNEALNFFLKGFDINDLLKDNAVDANLGAHYYGNLGRCYYFLNNYDYAERCYFKSFRLCYREENANKYLNRGYISYWLGQVLQKHGNYEIAYFFFNNCLFYWQRHSPHRAKRVQEEVNVLRNEIVDMEDILKIDHETIENQCKAFVEKQLFK
jgi:tetratricopeptide (TPR) repeat protein